MSTNWTILLIIGAQNTWSSVSTVTKMTMWRPAQFIHIKSSTVSDTNVVTPMTAFFAPVIAHFTSHHPLGLGRMRSTQPSRCMSSTVIYCNTLGWHSWSCSTREAVPLLDEPTLVTLENFPGISTCTVCIFQDGVFLTFWNKMLKNHCKYVYLHFVAPTNQTECEMLECVVSFLTLGHWWFHCWWRHWKIKRDFN